ncbi:MAG: hypothetical protein AMJ94_04550 [Deltaproteobacteria bacterium SM23_61]|nr:MAG: hypothetical protein AMJ94_04550 [Deltaproteobacteria bacterium SM23_61]
MTRATPLEFFTEFILTLSTCLYKSETRSTKFETNPKFKKANSKLLVLKIRISVIAVCFVPRFAGFEIRIPNLSAEPCFSTHQLFHS